VGPYPITPDALAQSLIADAIRASADTSATTAERVAALENLRPHWEADPTHMVQQALYFHNHHLGPDELETRLAAWSMISYFNVDDHAIVRAVLPFLETEHRVLREEVQRLLTRVERSAADFSVYRGIIAESAEDPPAALVRYMYRKRPGAAFLALNSVYTPTSERERRRAFLWAEHVVSDYVWRKEFRFEDAAAAVRADAQAELRTLATCDAWWARLYAAEIMQRHPEVRAEESYALLARDANHLVREAVAQEQGE
jgi:hypothetical protein